MDKKLQKKLFKKYPNLFQLKNKETILYERGLECGDGWYDLLDELLGSINSYLKVYRSPSFFTVNQIKQKCGGLRFYWNINSDVFDREGRMYRSIEGMIWFAAYRSMFICESCGKPGKFRRVEVLCDACNVDS